MDSNINELVEILEGEMSLYESSLELAYRERDAMSRYLLGDILDCQKVRKRMNLQMSGLDESRGKIIRKIAEEMDIPADATTLEDIICRVSGNERGRLEKCRLALKSLLEELSSVVMDNRRVARGSLDFIDQSIKILRGQDAKHSTYLSTGTLKSQDCYGNRMLREV